MISETLPNFAWPYLSNLMMGVLAALAYWKLKRSYEDSGIESVGYFSKFFGYFSLFMFLMGGPMLVPVALSGVKLGAFYIFGHIFLYISLAHLVLVPVSIYEPGYRKPAFWAIGFGGAVVTLVNLVYWNEPSIELGLLLLNVGVPVGPLIGVLVGLSMLSAGGFFAKMAWERSGNDRYKFALLALGMVVITVGGPLHDNATTLMMYVLADILTVSGFVFVMSGLYIDWVMDKLN